MSLSKAAARRKEDALDAVFSALAHPARRQLLATLASGSRSISELAAPFDMTLPAVSKHLRVLERAGLLRRERSGWYHHCHLDPQPLSDAAELLARYRPFWEGTLEALALYVERSSGRVR